jgi:transcriptional/translational regulatory protein YebC/TACO1
MPDLMHFAFIDESGTVGIPGGTHFLVVALLSTGQPREIELPIRHALKKYGPSLSRGEIKAANFEEKAIARLLTEIAKEDVSIFATIVDQSVIVKPPAEMEDIYRRAVSKTVYKLVEQCPRVNICLDRRYTNERHRFELESKIRESIQDLPQKVVMIQQENSISRKELQAVDAVAWAFFQKYERDNASFYELISSKIIAEEIIQERDWTK